MPTHQYESRFARRELSSFTRILLFCLIPLVCFFGYKWIFNPTPSPADLVIVFTIGIGAAFVAKSLLRSPAQFFVALGERVRWVALHLVAGIYVVVNILKSIVSIIIKLFFWAILLLIYLLSPIDLIPDFLIPVGFIDDFGAIMLFIFSANFALSQELKAKARDAIARAQIETSFP